MLPFSSSSQNAKINWSVDRLKFEIEELDKVYQSLNEKIEECQKDIRKGIQMRDDYDSKGDYDSVDFMQEDISALIVSQEQYKVKMNSNRNEREELLKSLRNKL